MMKGNIPIPELAVGEEVWLIVVVNSVRERRTQQGKLFYDAQARNATGTLNLKIWGETLETWKEMKPGLWGITGRLESFQDRTQFVVSEYRPVTLEKYLRLCRAPTRWTSRRLPCLTFATASDHNSNASSGLATCVWSSNNDISKTSRPKRSAATSSDL